MSGTQIGFRVDADLKEKAYATMKNIGVNPTDMFREVLMFIVEKGRLPVERQFISAEDAELLAMARERLKEDGETVSVTVNDLHSRVLKKSA